MQYRHNLGGIPTPDEQERQLAEEQEARDTAWRRLCRRTDEIRIIDFHTHTFPDKIAERALAQLSRDSGTIPFTDGTAGALQASMQEAGVDLSVVLPVVTNPEKVAHVNVTAAKQNCTADETGILSFAGIHPAAANYRILLDVVKRLGFKGIKLHPDYYKIPFNDIRTKRVVEYATELDLVVVTHAGTDIGLYPPVYCTVDSIVDVLMDVRPTKLVAAHMGGWNNWDEVADKLAGRNVWVDTAFSIGQIPWIAAEGDLQAAGGPQAAGDPQATGGSQAAGGPQAEGTPRGIGDPAPDKKKYGFRMLSDVAFVQLVYALGVNRVLFATDSPWAEQKDYVNRISSIPFTEEEKRKIFAENAKQLLGMPAAKAPSPAGVSEY